MRQIRQKLILFVFIIIANQAFAQNNCFDAKKIMAERDSAMLVYSKFSIDTAMSLNNKSIQNFKGCNFPENELFKLEGGKFNISELKGNLVLASFWETGCAPCIAELPEIIKLSNDYSKKKVKFLAITFEEKQRILTFLKDKKTKNLIETYSYRDVIDNKFCALFGYPMYMILDENGKVIDVWSGGSAAEPNKEFYEKVKKILDKNL